VTSTYIYIYIYFGNLLGVEFFQKGPVNDLILRKTSAAAKLVGMLHRQSRYFSYEKTRHRVMVSLMQPLVEYASPILNKNAPLGTLQVRERIQDSRVPGHQ
jgi:hypothetical protein